MVADQRTFNVGQYAGRMKALSIPDCPFQSIIMDRESMQYPYDIRPTTKKSAHQSSLMNSSIPMSVWLREHQEGLF